MIRAVLAAAAGFAFGAWWAVHGDVDEAFRFGALGDDLAAELEDALPYIDDYFVKKHNMREPLEAWRRARS